MSLEGAYIKLARAVDTHVDRKAPKILGPHIDEFAEVIEVHPRLRFHLMHSNTYLPADVMYFLPGCPPASLDVGDTVLIVGVFNENVVVDKIALGWHQTGHPAAANFEDQATVMRRVGELLTRVETLEAEVERLRGLAGEAAT